MRRREHFRIRKFARRYDRRTGKFVFNIAYETKTDVTDRTVAVAEAFGLGISDFQKHVLYDDVELKIGPKDIVYLTGDSGSGKSVLLKAVGGDLNPQEAVKMSDVEVFYKEEKVGTHRLDFIIATNLVVELKSVSKLTKTNIKQTKAYLKSFKMQKGLLINFPYPQADKPEIKVVLHKQKI